MDTNLAFQGLIFGPENSHVLQRLKSFILQASDTGATLPHVLLSGNKGTGKTSTLKAYAYSLSKGRNVNVEVLSGSALSNPDTVDWDLDRAGFRGVLLVDEIHGIKPKYADKLGERISEGMFQFTLAGATTMPFNVPKPLRSRMVHLRIEDYSIGTLARIARQELPKLTMDAAEMIAAISDGTPRHILVQLLTPLKAHLHAHDHQGDVGLNTIHRWMGEEKIDEHGLTPTHRRYMTALWEYTTRMRSHQQASRNTLASLTGYSEMEIENEIEEKLLRCGFIEKSSRGRTLSSEGRNYVRELQDALEKKPERRSADGRSAPGA